MRNTNCIRLYHKVHFQSVFPSKDKNPAPALIIHKYSNIMLHIQKIQHSVITVCPAKKQDHSVCVCFTVKPEKVQDFTMLQFTQTHT